MCCSKELSQILNTKFQVKMNKILTDFVIDFVKDDNEERLDVLHNQTIEEILYLFEEILVEINNE